MGDDPDQPKKVGSDMHAKKWSEYGGHGKYTSSDPIDSSRTTTSSGGDRGGFEPYQREGSGYPELPEHGTAKRYEEQLKRLRRKRIVKTIVKTITIHPAIFFFGFILGFYQQLCAFEPGIFMPFYHLSSCSPSAVEFNMFWYIFGSFYLILPLLTYFALFGRISSEPYLGMKRTAGVMISIVLVAMLFCYLTMDVELGWWWWGFLQ
jgi:hypothetical protein